MPELVALEFDAGDPGRQARFWAAALGGTVIEESADRVVLGLGDDTGFEIWFRREPRPKAGQNLIHFDLTTESLDDQRATVADLLARGGRHVDIGQNPADDHVVLVDPEGNELCVIGPTNRFLGDCPRLGAVNCDGTRTLGEFWSAVLDWPLVWDHDDETAIRDPHRVGPKITWSGPPLMERLANERLRFVVGQADLDRLIGLGADRLGARSDGAVRLADPDGNSFVVIPTEPRATAHRRLTGGASG